jgi:magnesium chelatase subunit I
MPPCLNYPPRSARCERRPDAIPRSGHVPSNRKQLREGLIARLAAGATLDELLPGIHDYRETVLPQVANAILAEHDLLLLGLRGQAKTRLARCLPRLLQERTQMLAGDPLLSHPLAPVGDVAEHLLAAHIDWAPVAWLARDERNGE